MKNILLTSLLAIAGAAAIIPRAHAAGTYDDGDLFLGFRSTDSSITNDFFVNLGQPDRFESAAPGSSFSLGNFGADLTSVFGSGFFSGTTLFSITGAVSFGTNSGKDVGSTLYTTVPVAQGGLFNARGDALQSTGATTISNLGGHFTSAPRNGASTAAGVIESASVQNSYRSYQPGGSNAGGISFSYFNPSNENSIVTTGIRLEELIATDDGSNAFGKSGAVLLGTVTVDSTGNAVFTAVPEPGSLTLLALGAVSWAGFSRRRRALA